MARGYVAHIAAAAIGALAAVGVLIYLQYALTQHKMAEIWQEMRGLVDPYYFGKVLELYIDYGKNYGLEDEFVKAYLERGGKPAYGYVEFEGKKIAVKDENGKGNKEVWGKIITDVLKKEVNPSEPYGALIFTFSGSDPLKYSVRFISRGKTTWGVKFISTYNFTSTYKPPELEDAFKDGEKIAELKIDVDGDGKEEDVYICRAEYEYNGKTYNATYAKVGGC